VIVDNYKVGRFEVSQAATGWGAQDLTRAQSQTDVSFCRSNQPAKPKAAGNVAQFGALRQVIHGTRLWQKRHQDPAASVGYSPSLDAIGEE
jgi:hypothetical protein